MTDGPQSTHGDEDIDDVADMDDLGAAPTVAISGQEAKKSRSSRTSAIQRMSRGRPRTKVLIAVGVVLLLAVIAVLPNPLKKTPRNMVGISYGGGPFEAAHFQRIVMPGSSLFFNGWFDPLYLYPADTQNYIVSKTVGQGAVTQPDSILAPSRDRVQVEYQIAVYFRLNIDRLQAFHESLGLQYSAFTASGWKKLITDTFRQQIENSLQEETRQYDVADLYGNADVLTKIQSDTETDLSRRLITALGQPFFCSPTYTRGGDCGTPTFIIKKIDIPPAVQQAFQDNRTSQIQVLTAQNTIAQRAAESQAIQALNVGLSQAGMPYVLLRAIETGSISFWVLPSDAGLTLQVPSNGGAPSAPSTPSSTSSSTGPPPALISPATGSSSSSSSPPPPASTSSAN